MLGKKGGNRRGDRHVDRPIARHFEEHGRGEHALGEAGIDDGARWNFELDALYESAAADGDGGCAFFGQALKFVVKVSSNFVHVIKQLLFFNVNQHRVRIGIQQSIEAYGVPEICEREGGLAVRVGEIEGVQTLFAVSELGKPLGVAVFVRLARERFVVLHLGVQPRPASSAEVNTRVLMRLMHEIRSAARRADGVDRIELVYKDRHSVRLNI